jgi:hypothetical protein
MSEPDHHEDDYRPRTLLQVLYGNPRRWIYIGLLVVVLVGLRLTGNI